MHRPTRKMDRRSFLKRASATAGGIVTASTLSLLAAHGARAQGHHRGINPSARITRGYGPLSPAADQNGDEILALPAGFKYVTFSKTGSLLLDGSGSVPRNHDGMTCLPHPAQPRWVRLIRNHENRNAPGDMTLAVPHAGTPYDPRGGGGTITIDFDLETMQPVAEFVSICGTTVNCAGGLAYRDAGWITCEETIAGPNNGFAQKHGYSFLVPVTANSATQPIALKGLGRFAHEAAVADARSGTVYQTEDSGNNSGLYRFVPSDPDDLTQGVLQMLAVSANPLFEGWRSQAVGRALMCQWVEITNPDPDLESGARSCFRQGRDQGGAAFNRLEGIFRGEGGSIYFVSTSGGEARYGQLWQYRAIGPEKGLLTLVFESPNAGVLDSPDNLCVTPSGAILFCEDDASDPDDDTHPLAPGTTNVNRLIGLSGDGMPFEFAVNRLNDAEFAGSCFSPDGNVLFVNIFGGSAANSGMTCAITGPWRSGPL
ncbi:MAG: alkaline phosphatase PhoX [Burkholderiales bacterium]